MQDLHMWRPTLVSPQALHLSYDHEIQLFFSSSDFAPDLTSATIQYVGPKKVGPTEGLFVVVQDLIMKMVKAKASTSLSSVRLAPCSRPDLS